MSTRNALASLIVLIAVCAPAGAAGWQATQPYRVILQLPEAGLQDPQSVVQADLNFTAILNALGVEDTFSQYSLRVEALDGPRAGESLPFRFDRSFNPADKSYDTAGRLVFTVPDAGTKKIAVYFGPTGPKPEEAELVPLIGDGDLLRLAGDGQGSFSGPACYPVIADFDGDGRRDIVGSDRYGTGALATCYRNIGTDANPAFSEREVLMLRTSDGQLISNPNRGWMLTVALCDWDGDGKRDLLAGGWCRYLTFHRNLGSDAKPVFAPGKQIFDAKVFPGLDYGSNPDTPYQGVFIEPCDWDGDGDLDLLCGTYSRSHIYFLPNTGRDADGLPVLGDPVALEADGEQIDFLVHNKPSVGDWDGDGDLDLMAGQYYLEATPGPKGAAGCYYFENIGDRNNPKLAAGVQIRDAEGRLCEMGYHMQPTMVDWNADDKMDVLISGADGTALYLNQGTREQPSLVRSPIPFRGRTPCQANGMFAYPVAVDVDADGTLDLVTGDGEGNVLFFKGGPDLQYASPVKMKSAGEEIDEVGCPDGGEAQRGYVKVALLDWNGDGLRDLIMWTNNGLQGWQRGWQEDSFDLKFFPGTADPLNFGSPQEITADGAHILGAYRSKPDLGDLDGDGLLDMVVATGGPTFKETVTLTLFKNIGTTTEWKLAAGVPLTYVDGKPCEVSVRTASCLVDWDGDGDLDLFTGNHSSMGVRYWENIGTKTEPVWAPARAMTVVNERVNSHHEVGVDAVDLDHDGTLDLVIGNGDSGIIHYFRGSLLKAQVRAQPAEAESKAGQHAALAGLTAALAAAEGRETMPVPEAEATSGERTWLLLGFNGNATGVAGEQPVKEVGEYVPGRFGQGLHLTGKPILSYETANNLDREGGVIQLWVKPDWDAGDGAHHYLVSADNGFPKSLLWLLINDKGELTLQSCQDELNKSPTTILRTPKLGWSAGEWHFVRASWDASSAKLFLDGVAMASAENPALPAALADRFYVGAMFNGNWCLEGTIDDLEIMGLSAPPE